jgi:hypothetical protein
LSKSKFEPGTSEIWNININRSLEGDEDDDDKDSDKNDDTDVVDHEDGK